MLCIKRTIMDVYTGSHGKLDNQGKRQILRAVEHRGAHVQVPPDSVGAARLFTMSNEVTAVVPSSRPSISVVTLISIIAGGVFSKVCDVFLNIYINVYKRNKLFLPSEDSNARFQ